MTDEAYRSGETACECDNSLLTAQWQRSAQLVLYFLKSIYILADRPWTLPDRPGGPITLYVQITTVYTDVIQKRLHALTPTALSLLPHGNYNRACLRSRGPRMPKPTNPQRRHKSEQAGASN